MPTVNLVKAVLHWSGYGEEGTIGWHVGGLTSMPDEGDLSDFLAALDDNLSTAESPNAWSYATGLLPAGQTYDYLAAYAYPNGHSPAAAQAQRAVSHVGASGNTMPPLQVSVVASLRTDRPGRSYRGRQYWPGGYADVAATTAKLSTAQCEAYVTAASLFGVGVKESAQSTFANNDAYWGVFSRTRDTVTAIKNVLVDNVADVQRRRARSLLSTHTSSQAINSNP